MSAIKLDIRQLPHGEGLPLPAYQSAHAAGLDLLAAVPEDAPLVLAPGKHAMVPTGLAIALPQGFEAQVRPRSGLAAKHGITALNSPGTVDADYRGEIQVHPDQSRRGTVCDSPRRAHRADGDRAGGAGTTQCRRFAARDQPRQRRFWVDRTLIRRLHSEKSLQPRRTPAFLHSEVCVHGLDSYRSTPLGDILV